MNTYYIARDGQQTGPFQEAEVQRSIQSGHISPTDLCWREGMANWQPVASVFTLAATPPALPIGSSSLRTTPGRELQSAVGSTVVYAGFWRRAGAVIIDGLILLIPTQIVDALLTPWTGPMTAQIITWFFSLFGDSKEPFPTGTWLLFQFIALLTSMLTCFYFAAMQGRPRAATVGKMAVGSVVLNQDGKPLSFWMAFLREFVKNTLWSLTMGLAVVPAAFTKRKQALHDLMFSTIVVQRTSVSAER